MTAQNDDTPAATSEISSVQTDGPQSNPTDDTQDPSADDTTNDGPQGDPTVDSPDSISSSDLAATSITSSLDSSALSSFLATQTAVPSSDLAFLTNPGASASLSSLLVNPTQTAIPSDVVAILNQPGGPSCYVSNFSMPLPLQNASQWNQTGCNLGFYCKIRYVFAPTLLISN